MSLRRAPALALICLAGIAPLMAQHYTYVSGVVVDPSASFVPAAEVNVVNEDTGYRRTALTESNGAYLVSSLEPGIYKVSVRKEGFRTMIRFGVHLSESRPARIDFNLVIGSVEETVTVEGSARSLDGDDGAVETVVERGEIENLAPEGGGLLTLLELAPGLVATPATRGEAGQFTVNGQRPNTHYFTVDGASANSGVSGGGVPAQSNGGALPGMTAFGSFDNLVSSEALDELRIQTSSTAPEFGRLPGAQIALSSRSGSNQFHGSLLYAFRNSALNANDWFANQHGDPRAPLQLHDVGAALGGPLWRNHTFFFLSYEGIRLKQPFVWRQPVPSDAARQAAPDWVQPLLNFFPAPNGPALGDGIAQWTAGFSRPSGLDIGAARLDQAITPRLTAFARYSHSPSWTEYGSNPVDFLDLRTRSLTLGLNFRARPNLILDLRVNASDTVSDSEWKQAPPAVLPACYVQPVLTALFATSPCDTLMRLAITGVGQVVFGSEGRRRQSQFQVSHTVDWSHGAHQIALGADYRRLIPRRQDVSGADSIIAENLSDFVQTNNLWLATSPRQVASGTLEEVSLFAEDTFRVTPRFTAKYGVRWEFSPAPTPSAPVNFIDPNSGTAVSLRRPLWNAAYTNLAPRLGLSYRLGDRGRTVLRLGGGLYYDSSLSFATDLVNDGPLNVSQYTSGRNGFVSTLLQFGFLPDLRMPLVKQWNASIERALSEHDFLSVAYVGSAGNDLIRREVGGAGSTNTLWYAVATNHGRSEYHGLLAQYRRRMARGVQALVSYSWSHSMDNSSTDSGLYWAGSGLGPGSDRASSDFDVRHSLSAGFTYEGPARPRWLRGWAVDGMFRARTGFPINVLEAEQYTGIAFENIFRPDLLPGFPVWISDPFAPGGRRINPAAFVAAPGAVQGNLGRNAVAGFGMYQLDLALRRDVYHTDRRSLQLRVEAWNALNHPNFGDPVRFLANPLFGQSSSMLNLMLGTGSPGSGLAPLFQGGGARSLQMALRYRF